MTQTPRQKTLAARRRARKPSPEMIRFAQECRDLRLRLDKSQEEFAALLGLKTKFSVSRWERVSGHMPSKAVRERFEKLKEK